MLRVIALLLIAAAAFYLIHGGGNGSITADRWTVPSRDVGERLKRDPVQQPITPRTVPLGEGQLTLKARYDITARVLSRKPYRIGKESGVSPLDLALGWKEMSSFSNISQLDISQGGRFYRYRWTQDGPPLDSNVIAMTSANTHIIPASEAVRTIVSRAKPGQIVQLIGYLVDYQELSHSGGWRWASSMTRTDRGAGGCELMYVESAEIL